MTSNNITRAEIIALLKGDSDMQVSGALADAMMGYLKSEIARIGLRLRQAVSKQERKRMGPDDLQTLLGAFTEPIRKSQKGSGKDYEEWLEEVLETYARKLREAGVDPQSIKIPKCPVSVVVE